ncbi:MAG: filamentous hemagglutinin N-terminal domain-containing protein [Pleurocapsa sp. MO_192.B19]|nr:filamentous hemagglutinin N-terminal domain-containing protein [Pleurocapsa sp. MO_192.B19]
MMTLKFFNLLTKNIGLNFSLGAIAPIFAPAIWGGFAIAFYYFNAHNVVQAQVIEDNTLSTEVNTENNLDFTVNAGEQRGNNLFHSFQEFSIPNNGSVLFNNAATIQNIITRVTGSSISDINGLIQSNGKANLFLINPNGIIFGENARLNIGGSFIGTTAESLVFEDGSQFSANEDKLEALLTVSVPLGLQFGSNPGSIINQANFSIPNPADPTGQSQIKQGLTTATGKTLALLGGDITFDGGAITAPTGNIELGSVAENSFLTLNPISQGFDVGYENVSQFQDIKLDNLANADASGAGAGDINVSGKNIQIFNGSAITSNTLGGMDGGTIQIQASDLVEINGSDRTGTKLDPFLAGVEIFLPFASQISSDTLGVGEGGDIKIITQDLQLIDGGAIELQTLPGSTGNGGNLSIVATEFIQLKGNRPLLGVGDNASNLILPTLDLDTAIEINQGSEIATVSISSGDGGNIDIAAKNIRLEDGATIGVSPFSSGNAGNINLKASQSLEVLGTSLRTGSSSSVITANTFAEGNSGNININTDKLTIKDGGQVISFTISNGNAGNITIDTLLTEISGFRVRDQIPSLITTEANNGGDGGNIFLNTGSLVVSDQASLSVKGSSSSLPGNLIISANSVELNSRASITAETAFQSGGNIQLNIQDNLTLQQNSVISAQALANANGGNIDIDAKFIIASPQQNNDILANAVGGNGGNININAQGIFGIAERDSQPPNLTNDIDASSEFGAEGTVAIAFPQFDATQGLFNLDSDFVDVDFLLKNNFCKISQDSKYIVTGRGGIPFVPEQDMLAESTWSDWRIVDKEVESVEKVEDVVEVEGVKKIEMIQGWVVDRQGKVILTANPLVVTPHQPELNSPDCNQSLRTSN